MNGQPYQLPDGAVVIAAITSLHEYLRSQRADGGGIAAKKAVTRWG